MKINAANPIVEENNTMTQQFRTWVNEASKWFPIIGEGSPEGVVEAPQFSLYIDKNGIAGAVQYRKMLTDIAGNRKQGWIAV